MSGVLITAFALVAGVVALWLLIRYVVLALINGHRVVITASVAAVFIAAVVFAVAMIGRDPVSVVIVVASAVLAATVYLAGLWVVFGTTTEHILDRAAFVARGLLMKYSVTDRALMSEVPGGGGVRVLGELWGVSLLRVTTSSGSKKSLLFSKGLFKFIGKRGGSS